MWGGSVAGQGPKTSVKWSCFRNRSCFTPLSCHSFLPAVSEASTLRQGASWATRQATPAPHWPVHPACRSELHPPTPPAHTHTHNILFAGAFPEVIITWELPVISPGLSQPRE